MAKPRPVRVIAVTSGKGGVGKTNITVNLAIALAQAGKDVMIMDADLGLANIDVLLGVYPKYNLSHLVNGERTLEEIIINGPEGIRIIPAASGIQRMADLTKAQHAGLINAFSELSVDLDVLLVDTAAGISDSVLSFSKASQDVLVVICDEPTSLTDAYALIKILNRDFAIPRFRVVSNMVDSANGGRELFAKLARVTDHYLDVTLDYAGAIPYDEYLRKSVQKQRAVVDAYPRSKAAMAFRSLAKKIEEWPIPLSPMGHVEFFLERLIESGQCEQKVIT
ncbi:MAG: cobyrinic acid a,c-diamide synthase [Gammaproteobacteria bacterium RBG_16_57_12]|nr:MAG: cobyrinic acid a,c-diamide synthase [Gammaproteobacteria bacterium RBG_16_57_12]